MKSGGTWEADILVVGLGPAGSSAAAAAAAAGARVIALDSRAAPGLPVQCAEFVPALLAQEIPDLAARAVQPISRMHSFVESAAPDITPDFPGHMIDRAAFDRALAEAAAAAGAICRYRQRVVAIDPAAGQLRTSDGATYRARVLIGADGPRSRLGAATGRVNRALVETRQITVALHDAHTATDIFLSSDYPGGYAWLFPKGSVANLGLGVAAAARARLKPLLADLHATLVAQGRVGQRILGHTGGAIPVGGRLVPVAWRGAVPILLAGDALGLANPITGAGIAAAVQSGRLAGAAAAAWAAGTPDALDEYEEELALLFDSALARALDRRATLAAIAARHPPAPAALRAGWIAYPPYWAAPVAHAAQPETLA